MFAVAIPTNIHTLLSGNVVEWARIEFKTTWDPEASLKTITAFANDLDNTTGAGDTFCACVLNYVLEHGDDLDGEQRREMLRFANAAAYLVTTKKGAIRSMPERTDMESILKNA